MRSRNAAHQIEYVGEELRSMMSWLNAPQKQREPEKEPAAV
jgi:ketol-acid reductoisomerase